PPDLASLDVDEPAATSTAATSHAATSPATTTATSSATATLARGELDAALADFSTLAASFRATFTPAGLRFDTLRDGTLLTRIGLRKGDVITSIDGQPLRSLDDAANLYARASSLRAATIQVTRAGQPITLRVAIR
ncbi:MAG TPA: PDZ domain-containing protein, partial [Kofleriaceae bacterium]|nr:PDZ domain-containing protein [Kofleriaceae bacterium]